MAERGARVRRRVVVGLGVVVIAGLVAFLVWAWTPAAATETALAAAVADERVEVTEQDGTWTLRPVDGAATTGVVFYPGARVQPAAYVANWTPIVAASGVEVVIPRMPLNLAVFGRARAADVIDEAPGIERWFVGGHSLGGAMASSWLGGSRDDRLAGAILWASFPTGGAGLDQRPELAVLSVGGTRDGLSTPDDLRERRELLPPDAQLVFVEGMNHAQFGRYGDQAGDLDPTIDDAEAAAELARITTAFLDVHG
jgi:pimeloyl-ACP methyl ester carboxylesterase